MITALPMWRARFVVKPITVEELASTVLVWWASLRMSLDPWKQVI